MLSLEFFPLLSRNSTATGATSKPSSGRNTLMQQLRSCRCEDQSCTERLWEVSQSVHARGRSNFSRLYSLRSLEKLPHLLSGRFRDPKNSRVFDCFHSRRVPFLCFWK